MKTAVLRTAQAPAALQILEACGAMTVKTRKANEMIKTTDHDDNE
jgi:hypothetical protein